MVLKIKKPNAPKLKLVESTLKIFDIPNELLIDSPENPNEQDEATFDQLVQSIKEDGFDEPCHVIPIEHGPNAGKYIIVAGHHRKKAGILAGKKATPCIIKPGWSDDKRLIELVRRNQLHGQLSPDKFAKLFTTLAKRGYDKSVLQLQMGFTKDEVFKKLFKQVEKSLTPAQKKKLVEAKERITSVNSFSSVLNDIFTEHGSELDNGLVSFTYGGKKNYYVECDAVLAKQIEKLQKDVMDRGIFAADVFKHLLSNVDFSKIKKSDKVEARKALRIKKK